MIAPTGRFSAPRCGPMACPPGPLPRPTAAGLISIPGLNCIDDFSIYLVDDGVRRSIIDRFIDVVRPELEAGNELDIIAHSWGSVVAYEGLRQLEDEGLNLPLVRNLFTVGSALSIGPVKLHLREANRDGKKPASLRRWVNLDAHGESSAAPSRDGLMPSTWTSSTWQRSAAAASSEWSPRNAPAGPISKAATWR